MPYFLCCWLIITTFFQFLCLCNTLVIRDIHYSLSGCDFDCTWLAWHQTVHPVSDVTFWTSHDLAHSRPGNFYLLTERNTPIFSAFCGGAHIQLFRTDTIDTWWNNSSSQQTSCGAISQSELCLFNSRIFRTTCNTPFFAAFCGGAPFLQDWFNFSATELPHGIQLTFCRGVPISSTTPTQLQQFRTSDFWQHCTLDPATAWGDTHKTWFCLSDNNESFLSSDTPNFSAFCGGALASDGLGIIFHWTELLHGSQLTFCRGVPHSSTTPLQLQETLGVGRTCTTDLVKPCGANIDCVLHSVLRTLLALDKRWAHGIFSAFCRGAFDSPSLKTETSDNWIFYSSDSFSTPLFLAFCGGAWFVHRTSHGIPDACGQFRAIAIDFESLIPQRFQFTALSTLPHIVVSILSLFAFHFVINHFLRTLAAACFYIWIICTIWQTAISDLRIWPQTHCSLWVLRDVGGPGPNSGRSRNSKLYHIFWVVLLIQLFQMTSQTWSGGEGCVFTTEDTEAPATWETALINQLGAKPRGTQPTNCFGNPWLPLDSVKKRSLKRAYNRALRDGSCWYRGQCYTAKRLAGVP